MCWPCCWVRCWRLQDMDHMEASCVFYVKVPRFDQLVQSKICILTVTSLGILIITVHHSLMISMWFMLDPVDVLRQTSPDILSVEDCPLYIYQTRDFSCRSWKCSPLNIPTISDRLTAIRRNIRIPCSYTQLGSTWMEYASWLSHIQFWLVANNIILIASHFLSLSPSSPVHNSKSWLHKHLSQVRLDPNWAVRQVPHHMHHRMKHSTNTDTSLSTATLQLQPLTMCPWTHISTWCVNPEAAWIRRTMRSNVSNSIS